MLSQVCPVRSPPQAPGPLEGLERGRRDHLHVPLHPRRPLPADGMVAEAAYGCGPMVAGFLFGSNKGVLRDRDVFILLPCFPLSRIGLVVEQLRPLAGVRGRLNFRRRYTDAYLFALHDVLV